MDPDEMDIDDENDWKAIDSDEEDTRNHDNDDDDDEIQVERDDDVDIGFRSHQFQYGSHAGGRNRKRSRQQNQEEAIYGVFYNNDSRRRSSNLDRDNDNGTNAAPMFVPASVSKPPAPPMFVAATKTDSTPPPMFVAASKKDESNVSPPAPMFVSATNNIIEKSTKGEQEIQSKTKPDDAATTTAVAAKDQEEEQRFQKEQKEADDRFLDLLEKAKARNKSSRRTTTLEANEADTTTSTTTTTTGLGLGMSQGLGLPSSFGGSGSGSGGGGGLGFSSMDEVAPARKDPTVGTWEKHTKGFGSKLLAKMGWRGSGGLGSNRRAFRGQSASTIEPSKDKTTTSTTTTSTTTTPTTTTTTTTTTTSEATKPAVATESVKKGISRPVEVVVRPTNMGLGFGNFKEASQLKSNRRIEAEVRGIDYDAQLAKEKQQSRAKRRQKRKQRYGNHYGSSSDEENDDDDENGTKNNVQSSAIPSTNDLLSKQSWKAKRSNRSNRNKKGSGLPEIIPYQELIKRQNQKQGSDKVVIIDMRGPQQEQQSSTSMKGQKVALGEELLYNLSFLLGTYENKLHSSSRHHETSILRTIHGLDNQIREAEDRLQTAANRRAKLAKAYEIAEIVRNQESQEPLQKKRKVNHLVSELKDIFTALERKELQFWNVLAPTLLGPTMQSRLDHWKPFSSKHTNRESDRAIIDSFFEWATPSKQSSGETEGRILCESMIRNQLIPKLKSDIEAQAFEVWCPVTNPYAVLDVYEYLHAKAVAFDSFVVHSNTIQSHGDDSNQVFAPNREDEEQNLYGLEKKTSSNLAEYIRNELIREAVYPKLLGAIATWKPTLSNKIQSVDIQNPLHLWVLPWLPHIDYPILLPNLLSECKRKLKSVLSVLQRRVGSDATISDLKPFVAMIRPWRIIMGPKSLQKMVSENTRIVGILEKLFRKSFDVQRGENDWKNLLLLLFELYGNQLLSDVDFLILVEGPFLTTWAMHIYSFLCGRTATLFSPDSGDDNTSIDLDSAVEAYRECKIGLLVDPLILGGNDKTSSIQLQSLHILRNDERICRIFYSVARMVQIRQISSANTKEIASELDSIEPVAQLLSAIRNRRSLEEKDKSRATEIGDSREASKAKAVLRRRNILEPTFREVVETFASDRGVIFRPKLGVSSDGKQVYLFGKKTIYLDGDVVFYQDGSNNSWKPVSLDQMGMMA